MSKPLIYLAGPVSGIDHSQGVMWRDYGELSEHAGFFKFASPLRGKQDVKVSKHIVPQPVNILTSDSAVMARDSWDVGRCDAVFANLLDVERVSIGTVMEIAWAWQLGTPVVLVMRKNSLHDHPMIRAATPFLVDTIDEGIDVLYALFGD